MQCMGRFGLASSGVASHMQGTHLRTEISHRVAKIGVIYNSSV